MTEPFEWPNPNGPSDSLCSRCANLRLDIESVYYSISDEESNSYGIRWFNWYRDDRLILAQDRVANLSKTASCPLCQLIIAAVREQYLCANASVASNHVYALLCRYVPLRFRRHESKDTAYIRYIEIISPANCDINESKVRTEDFHIKDQIVSRDTMRSILAPMASSKSTPEYLNARALEDQVDFNLLREWLHRCEKLHGKDCTSIIGELEETLPSNSFMVIDTQGMHLTTPAPASRYAALSYCWGPKGKNSFLTTLSNVTSLREPGGLKKVWDQLPATIQDAILLAQRTGERYLWIDSLCIVQDDDTSIKENIHSMKRIYTETAVTIIAASGKDATAGLPGVRPGTRSSEQQARSLSPGCRFALIDDIELAMMQCPWVKRGWTFQEWFLSSKCLIFIKGCVVFSCYRDTWREDIAGEAVRPNIEAILKSNLHTADVEPQRRGFLRRIFAGSRKRPPKIASAGTAKTSPGTAPVEAKQVPKDTPEESIAQGIPLNDRDFSYVAVGYELRPSRRQGIVTDLDKEPTDVFMMTLREYWDRELRYADDRVNAFQGILDYHAKMYGTTSIAGTLARFTDWAMILNANGERKSSFPSWSWAGWSGKPTWLMQNDVFQWMNYSCWIVWHFRGQEPESIVPVERGLTVVYDATSPVTAESLKVSDEEDWKDLDSLAATIEWFIFKKGWKREATATRLPDGPLCTAAISGARGFAQFWTIVLPVTFDAPVDLGEVKLFDSKGVACGEVTIDQLKIGTATPDQYEVIMLSEANWSRGVRWAYVDKHQPGDRAPDIDIVDGKLNVMLIGWVQGIAERMGIGMVWKEVITYSPKEELVWKEIVLA